MSKALKTLGSIFYGTLVVAVVLVAGALMATMMPIPGNIEIKIVKSGSMEPAIPTGSLVVIKPEANYQVGDVITFGKDTMRDIPTTHRVVKIDELDGKLLFTTKGDANEEPDQMVTRGSEVIGKVIFSVPRVGFILDFARTRNGFILMIVIPAMMVILDEMLTIWGELRRNKKPKVEPVPAAVAALPPVPSKKRLLIQKPPRKLKVWSVPEPHAAFNGVKPMERERPARVFPSIATPEGISGIIIRHA